jgi:hypothetical protein
LTAASVALLCAALLGGCSVALGVSGTRSWSMPRSDHLGSTVQGILALPRDYRWVVGAETSTFLQTSPDVSSDQWRTGLLAGYASPPQPTERWGWEVLGRAQVMRGSDGTFNKVGGVFGASVAFPWRTSSSRDPWQVDELFALRGYVVPSLGMNAVMGRDQSAHLEVVVGLSVRAGATSTVVP